LLSSISWFPPSFDWYLTFVSSLCFRPIQDITTPLRKNAAVHHSKNCALMSQMGLASRVTPVHTALRNSTRDEGGPFGFDDQDSIPSHRKLLWSKAMVVSVAERAGHDPVRRD